MKAPRPFSDGAVHRVFFLSDRIRESDLPTFPSRVLDDFRPIGSVIRLQYFSEESRLLGQERLAEKSYCVRRPLMDSNHRPSA